VDRLDEDIDVSELELTHYRLTKRAEQELRWGWPRGIMPSSPITDVGSGKPHDPEKKRLSEIIERLNDLFGAEVERPGQAGTSPTEHRRSQIPTALDDDNSNLTMAQDDASLPC
jgi:hypothetical protein